MNVYRRAQGTFLFWKNSPLIIASPERLLGVLKAVFFQINGPCIFGSPERLPGVLKARFLFSRKMAPRFLVVPLYLEALLYLDQPLKAFLKEA